VIILDRRVQETSVGLESVESIGALPQNVDRRILGVNEVTVADYNFEHGYLGQSDMAGSASAGAFAFFDPARVASAFGFGFFCGSKVIGSKGASP
jgi:hypothetical protein